jgi:phosphoribosylanthranilate isomerase
MSKVKICGVTSAETVHLLAELGVDYIGFVFAESRRRVTAEQAGSMLKDVPDRPAAVGVFVNPTLAELEEVLARVPLEVIQLHGQETAEFCREIAERFGRKIWKAISVDSENRISAELEPYKPLVEAFLFDTHDAKQAGGTGKRFSWERIPALKRQAGERTCVIAGGINEANVSELLRLYAPEVIDVSSGVETDGRKDHEKITSFLRRVREHDQPSISKRDRT